MRRATPGRKKFINYSLYGMLNVSEKSLANEVKIACGSKVLEMKVFMLFCDTKSFSHTQSDAA
jgi:hypothetical protein